MSFRHVLGAGRHRTHTPSAGRRRREHRSVRREGHDLGRRSRQGRASRHRGRRAIAGAVPLDRRVRLLEYGAGTGLVTQALRDAVGPVTFADASAGMREVMHTKINAGELPAARVWALDLATDPSPDESFDLIVTVLTLHHIPILDGVLAGFAQLLEPGGHLCIVDLDEEDGSFHEPGFEGHHGFPRPLWPPISPPRDLPRSRSRTATT